MLVPCGNFPLSKDYETLLERIEEDDSILAEQLDETWHRDSENLDVLLLEYVKRNRTQFLP